MLFSNPGPSSAGAEGTPMPRLTINLGKIEQNARLIAELLGPHGVRLVGVTKPCRGHELRPGPCWSAAPTRLPIHGPAISATCAGISPGTEIEFLRSMVSADDVGFDADIYFVSSVQQAESLLRMTPNRPLKFCLLIETGDGREGVPLEQAPEEAARLNGMEEALLAGLATNAACARGDLPVGDALETFNDVAGKITWRLDRGHREDHKRAGHGLTISPPGTKKTACCRFCPWADRACCGCWSARKNRKKSARLGHVALRPRQRAALR